MFGTLVIYSCSKTSAGDMVQYPPVSLDSLTRCYNSSPWDSASIHTTLLGKWNWEVIQCFGKPEFANAADYKTLEVDFLHDSNVTVRDSSGVSDTSTWVVVNLNDGYFGLKTTPLILQLPGRIIICGDRIVFSDSYTDGCDNFFVR